MASQHPFRALRHPGFRFLWLSSTTYQTGYWVLYTAMQLVVANLTDHSPIALGVLQFSLLVPYLLLSVPFGVLADQMDRRRILRIGQAIGLTSFTAVAVLSLTGLLGLWQAALVGFVTGCTSTLLSASLNSMLPNLVPRADLTSAAPLQTASGNLGRTLGPALATPLIWLGGTNGMFIAALLLLAVAIGLGLPLPAARPAQPMARESMRRSMAAGLDHARRRPPAISLLTAVAVTSVFGGGFQAQQPVVAAKVAPENSDQLFLWMATLGGAAALVAVGLSAAGRRTPSLAGSTVLMMLLGVSVAGLGLATAPWLALACAGLSQALVIAVMTRAGSALQHIVDDAFRGRVMSLYFVGWGGLLPFGGLGMGLLMDLTTVTVGLLTFGAIVAGVGVLLLVTDRQGRAPLTD